VAIEGREGIESRFPNRVFPILNFYQILNCSIHSTCRNLITTSISDLSKFFPTGKERAKLLNDDELEDELAEDDDMEVDTAGLEDEDEVLEVSC